MFNTQSMKWKAVKERNFKSLDVLDSNDRIFRVLKMDMKVALASSLRN